jgi:hypothetical protein
VPLVRLALGLVVLCAFAAALTASASLAAARATEGEATKELLQTVWPDQRIVVNATCLGLNGRGSARRTRFACRVEAARRPARIVPAQWAKVAAALRSGDTPRVRAVLGIRAGATQAQIAAAVHRWGLDRTTVTIAGLRVTAGRWHTGPAPLTAVRFANAARAQSAVRSAVRSIKAYYADHRTYARMTTAALRSLNSGLARNLVVTAARRRSYCVSVKVGSVAFAFRGPAGPAVIGACH